MSNAVIKDGKLVILDAKMAIAQVMNILMKSGSSRPSKGESTDGTQVLRAEYPTQEERDSAIKELRGKIKPPQKMSKEGSKKIKVSGPMV